MLAHDIVLAAPAATTVVALARAELDVTDAGAVGRVIASVSPHVIINCAAYTAVDRAESEPQEAHAVNAIAPGTIGQSVVRLPLGTAHVVHFSTDYVFDGSANRPYVESDPPAPLGVYGRTKLAGEWALRTSGAVHTIIRPSWLYGEHGRSFARTMWDRAVAGLATRVVDDQVGRPTSTRDLAAAVWSLLGAAQNQRATGVLHVSNVGDPVTWYGVAQRIFMRAGQDDLLTRCTTSEYPTTARRPPYSVLDTGHHDIIGTPLPAWDESLNLFIDRLESP